MWPALQNLDEPRRRPCEQWFDATLLAAEVSPDRSGGQPGGLGDVVAAGAGDSPFPEERAGVPGHRQTRLLLFVADGFTSLSLSDISNVSLSDSGVKAGGREQALNGPGWGAGRALNSPGNAPGLPFSRRMDSSFSLSK